MKMERTSCRRWHNSGCRAWYLEWAVRPSSTIGCFIQMANHRVRSAFLGTTLHTFLLVVVALIEVNLHGKIRERSSEQTNGTLSCDNSSTSTVMRSTINRYPLLDPYRTAHCTCADSPYCHPDFDLVHQQSQLSV